MQPIRFGSILCCLIALAALLAGCGALTGTRPALQTAPAAEEPLAKRALALQRAGAHARAAALFLELAKRGRPEDRAAYSLAAAESLLMDGQTAEASRVLRQVDTARLDRGGLVRTRILTARIALASGSPAAAAAALGPRPAADLDAQLQRGYYATLADAARQAGDLTGSARALAYLDRWLQDRRARQDNQLALLRLLTVLPPSQLAEQRSTAKGDYAGWIDLALIVGQHPGDADALRAGMNEWRLHYPRHPADQPFLVQRLAQLGGALPYPRQIAVLLPRQGPYAEVSGALTEGILAAYYQQPQAARPLLRFYNVPDAQRIWPQLQRAVQEGASFVLGPLQKEGVALLARAGKLPVPVLALNSVDMSAPPPQGLFQFGLPPEDEARLVAERAWLDGARQALTLTPKGPWGERLLRAFHDRFAQLGGHIVGQAVYDPAKNDFSDTLRGLLNIDESEARQRSLQQLLGQRLEFEPRRRQDADFLFLGANVVSARKIRPQLQFHHAADLPVYATSQVFSGAADPRNDLDLDGVLFPDMPWLLLDKPGDPLSRSALGPVLPQSGRDLPRIVALGMDSYRLIPQLEHLQLSAAEAFEGATGMLWVDALRQIHRRLPWARFRRGVPQVLGYPPALPSPVPPQSSAGDGPAPRLPAPTP